MALASAHLSPGRRRAWRACRVYILPTRDGLLFACTLLVMLLGAANYDNSLGYLLTFLLTGLGLVGMLHTHRNVADLRISGAMARPVFAGQMATFRIGLVNPSRLPRDALRIRYRMRDAEEREDAGQVFTDLAANALSWVEVPVFASRRGHLKLEELTVETRYPLGLFRAWFRATTDTCCLVWPRPGGRLRLPVTSAHSAQDSASSMHGGDDFAGFRAYVPGDSPRQIHWKAVARNQGVPIKVFAGSSSRLLILRWDDAYCGDAERTLSQLCRWVLDAQRSDLVFGLELPTRAMAPARGEAQRYRCLAALAQFGTTRE